MPTNIFIFEEPDRMLMPIDPFDNVPNVSRSKEAVFTHTIHKAIYGTYHTCMNPSLQG